MLHYLVEIIKERDHIPNPSFKKLNEILEFNNNENKTPMFLAAQYNHINCVMYLCDLGVNIY